MQFSRQVLDKYKSPFMDNRLSVSIIHKWQDETLGNWSTMYYAQLLGPHGLCCALEWMQNICWLLTSESTCTQVDWPSSLASWTLCLSLVALHQHLVEKCHTWTLQLCLWSLLVLKEMEFTAIRTMPLFTLHCYVHWLHANLTSWQDAQLTANAWS